MNEIMKMYTQFEQELENRIAASRRDMAQSQVVIFNAQKNIERDMDALVEIRRLMEEYR